jgi:D-lactate dehydrogenase
MGPSPEDPRQEPLPEVVVRLMERAGLRVILPEGLGGLCCGLPFESKGFPGPAAAKRAEVLAALDRAGEGGRLPVMTDTSPCAFALGRVQDLTDFLHDVVLPRLPVRRRQGRVAVHATCSGQKKLGNAAKLRALAAACAEEVVVPEGIACCGFAGDKGFLVPELGEHALRHLRQQVAGAADEGCSTSRSCEIGLSDAAGLPYRSVAYLVERASRPE